MPPLFCRPYAWRVACLFKGGTSRTTCPCPVGLCMSVTLRLYAQRVNCPLRAARHWSLDSELTELSCANFKPENAPHGHIAPTDQRSVHNQLYACMFVHLERAERATCTLMYNTLFYITGKSTIVLIVHKELGTPAFLKFCKLVSRTGRRTTLGARPGGL